MKQEEVLINLSEAEKNQHIDSNIALRFSAEVFQLIETEPSITVLEALAEICANHSVNEEDVIQLLTPKLLSELTRTCEDSRLIKKTGNTQRLW